MFFWFFFKIPVVISDLSGRTARKSIAQMRRANEKTGIKSYQESLVNAERGKLTSTMAHRHQFRASNRPETGLLDENKADQPLADTTGFLDDEATSLLTDAQETAPLAVAASARAVQCPGTVHLRMLEQVMLVHTDEVIGSRE